MRILAVVLSCVVLGACSQSQDARAREQMHQTGEQLRESSRDAVHQAEADTARAGQELNRGLEKTREKMRKALDVPPSGAPARRDDASDRR
jgi:hypothetical protein